MVGAIVMIGISWWDECLHRLLVLYEMNGEFVQCRTAGTVLGVLFNGIIGHQKLSLSAVIFGLIFQPRPAVLLHHTVRHQKLSFSAVSVQPLGLSEIRSHRTIRVSLRLFRCLVCSIVGQTKDDSE